MKTRHSFGRRALKGVLVVVALVTAAPYAVAPVYRFPDPAPFRGSYFWNPYADLRRVWQRANLHAHGRAWVGLTNGRQSDEDVAQRYRDLGYAVPGVSDYQRIAARHGVSTIPIYEHGYNITKQHQLAIGARQVEWLDFLLWQSLSNQQYVIDRVRRTSELVALAHPATRAAYTSDDLRQLTGYELIEVVNGPFAVTDVWDAALSSGHPVWAVANDDTHDLLDPRRTAAGWNMIDALTASTGDIVDALRSGRTYAVQRTGAVDAANLTAVDDITVKNATLTVSVAGAASTFSFIGQNGTVRKTVTNTTAADYTLTAADSYVRTVIETPQTVLYLNPVIRYDGAHLPTPAATVDLEATWTLRASIGVGLAMLVFAYARRRRPSQRLATHPVLAAAKRKTA